MSSYAKRIGMIGAGLAARDLYYQGKRAVRSLTYGKKTKARKPAYTRVPALPRSFQSLKHFQHTRNVTSRKLHALYDDNLTDIAQGADLNDRERQQIFVRGIKLNVYTRIQYPYVDVDNLGSTDICYLRCVVALNRYRDDDYTVNGADGDESLFKGFNQLSTTSFSSHSNGLNTLTLPINTRKWQVLADFKQPLNTVSGNSAQPIATIIEKWIPVNKKLTYRNTAGNTGNNPIIVLWWYETPNYSSSGSTPLTPVEDRFVSNLYFNDIV